LERRLRMGMAMPQIFDKFSIASFALDGFDPDAQYQMVPFGGTRELVISTDKLPAKLTFSRQGIALVGNLRDFDTKQPLPGSEATRFVNAFDLPPNRKIQCTVKSLANGITILDGVDLPGSDNDIQFNFDLIVSVKPALERKFCFVFVSDLVRTTVRGKIEPRFLLDAVKPVFNAQANIQLNDIDNGRAFREVQIPADLGDPINIEDFSVLNKVDQRVSEVFPDLFSQTDFIVYLLWRVRGKHRQENLLGVNRQTSDKLNTVFLGLEPPTFEGRVQTMAHEFGNAMGLPHATERCLMFPVVNVMDRRLLGGHIEQLHTGPIFPDPRR
jgi:hypothetical protein